MHANVLVQPMGETKPSIKAELCWVLLFFVRFLMQVRYDFSYNC